eukprot:TRINITY_DN15951_c0_g1_i1.p1 TRINITY_DN15951_c0_g1~~TRINITY_DN15951_c0_g1_i1.p1  ORF type:complete len:277 (-),score=40.96 TRINITY_DN15951_c0_g1_i1:92-805(-)
MNIIHASKSEETTEKIPKVVIRPPIIATPEMAFYCFDVLQNHFKNHSSDLVRGLNKSKKRKLQSNYVIPPVECALFVGWKKDKPNGECTLRGCKGTHGTLPLEQGLRQYALISAFEDGRFAQMAEHELPHLSCSISLLYDFEDSDDCFDWELHTHGIKIEFEDSKNKYRSATFLPYVMTQFGFSKRQTIKRLIEKSGSSDKLTKSLSPKIRITRFKASDIVTHYSDWASLGSKKKSK